MVKEQKRRTYRSIQEDENKERTSDNVWPPSPTFPHEDNILSVTSKPYDSMTVKKIDRGTMQQLVFQGSDSIKSIPYTTSDVISKYAEISHHAVQQLVIKHEHRFREFGTVAFEMRACPHRTGSSTEKIYHFNEEQASLLIALLKNTEPVIVFKTELVRQFYLMRKELYARRLSLAERKPVRRNLTDVIQENPKHNRWDFKLFTDLAYKTEIGKNAAQIRNQRGAKKTQAASDFMTSNEINRVAKKEGQICVLYEMGLDYNEIKTLLYGHPTMKN